MATDNSDTTITTQDLFTRNLVTKIESVLDQNLGKRLDRLLIMSLELRPMLINPQILSSFTEKSIKPNFYENINLKEYTPPEPMVAFLISGQESSFRNGLAFIKSYLEAYRNLKHEITLIVYPKRSFINQIALNRLMAKFPDKIPKVVDLNFGFIPLEPDLLSLELPEAMEDIFRFPSFEVHTISAVALSTLQIFVGKFKNVFWKGTEADKVQAAMKNLSLGSTFPNSTASTQYHSLIIFDRTCDLFSALISQNTYLGMIDDLYDIRQNVLVVEKDLIYNNGSKELEEYYIFKQNEKLFRELKDLNATTLFSTFKEQFKKLKDPRKEKVSLDNADKVMDSIKENEKFVLHYNLNMKINNHLNDPVNFEVNRFTFDLLYGLCEKPAERLIELIQLNIPVTSILRILILSNLVYGGFAADKFEMISKEIIESYGVQMIKSLLELEKAGLFVVKGDKSANLSLIKSNDFEKVKKLLKNPQESKTVQATSYFGGYSPLSCKYIESLLNNEIANSGFSAGRENLSQTVDVERGVVVYFVGGVTYSELATLRSVMASCKNLLICTSNMIDSTSLAKLYTTLN